MPARQVGRKTGSVLLTKCFPRPGEASGQLPGEPQDEKLQQGHRVSLDRFKAVREEDQGPIVGAGPSVSQYAEPPLLSWPSGSNPRAPGWGGNDGQNSGS